MEPRGLANLLKESAKLAADNPDLGVFAEEPVSLDVFIQDAKFLKNPPLSLVQYNAVRAIERIYYPSLYPLLAAELDPKKNSTTIGPAGAFSHEVSDSYWSADIPMINNATLQWGKGSGKDHVCRMCSMRIAYLLMCLVSPQAYFGMPEQDTIHLLNVASSSNQAKEAFFDPITRAVKTGWFKGKAEAHVNSITYMKNVQCISGHSDAEGQEGKNLILGIADEIDAFKSRDELLAVQRGKTPRDPSRSAESILKMLRTSAKTRFPETYKVVRISYPRFRGSMIQQLTAQAEKDIKKNGKKSRHYVSGPLASWDVRPNLKREDFADDYEDDPVTAAAMYECKPARAMNPYFRNTYAVTSCLVETPRPAIVVDYRQEEDTWSPVYSFAEHLIPIQGARYAMHGDLAVNGDRAGISMAHVVKWNDFESVITAEDGTENRFFEKRPFVKVDFALVFESDISSDPPREIQIRWARQLAFELVKRGFHIGSFTFDGFESRDSIQILNAKGIPSKRVSTDLSEDPWKTLRDLMNDARCSLPYSELLEDELLSLTRLHNGKVDHLLGGSKDLADAVACACYGAVELGGQESEAGERSYYASSEFVVGPKTDIPFGLQGSLGLPWGMEQYLP